MPEFMSNDEVVSITLQQLQVVYFKYVIPLYKQHLESKGVKNPPMWGSNGAGQLALLAWNYPDTRIVSKEQAATILHRLEFDSTDFQALRHCGNQWGYCLWQSPLLKIIGIKVGKGHYWLKNLAETFPEWNPNRRKPHKSYDKKEYCSFCGGKVGDTNWRFTGIIESIDFQHADPDKSIGESGVWQCNICNRAIRDKYIFNEHGDIVETLEQRRRIRELEKYRTQVIITEYGNVL